MHDITLKYCQLLQKGNNTHSANESPGLFFPLFMPGSRERKEAEMFKLRLFRVLSFLITLTLPVVRLYEEECLDMATAYYRSLFWKKGVLDMGLSGGLELWW